MAILEERISNSCVKSLVFLAALVTCVTVLGVLWYFYPGNDKTAHAEVVDGKIFFRDLGLVYVYVPDVMDWQEAHEECERSQGHLAFPHSLAEAQALMEIMKNNSVKEVHVGFHDLFVDKEFVTVLGESLKDVGYQIKVAYPVKGPDVHCGRMAKGALIVAKCSEKLAAICRRPTWHDYTLLSGFGFYKLHTTPASWPTAWATCRREGGYLLVARSDHEVRAVQEAFGATVPKVHYGVHRLFAVNGSGNTIFDEPVDSSGFNIWDNSTATAVVEESVQSAQGNFPYVALRIRVSSPHKRGLYSTRAHISLPFVCKHDLH